MNNLRYIILTNYNGPPITSAAIIVANGKLYRAKKIEPSHPNASLGFPIALNQTLLTLRINRYISLDATPLRGGERDIMPYNGPAYQPTSIPWWLKVVMGLILIGFIGYLIWLWMDNSRWLA